jgi:NAD(P)-dependent dehydrogenase (short-subunit alcohol dehydrogenase family)
MSSTAATHAPPHAGETSHPIASAPAAPRLRGIPPGERRAIVIGASSGMGAALVRQLASEGYRVAALARRAELLEELERECAEACARSGGELFVEAHDVAEVEEVPELFERLVRRLGGLDLVVFAAGVMPTVGPQEFDTRKDLEMLRVNLAGCIAWCNPVANLFRTQRRGTLVGISSVAGARGRRGNPVYCTSKAAMNTYLESLRNRLGEHGVRVVTIKPGFVDTAMTRGMDGLFWLIGADVAAQRILRAARGGANVRYVPMRWFWVMAVIRSIPSFVFRKLDV